MRTMTKWAGAVALAAMTAGMAHADDTMLRSADHNGALELSRGDYAAAERVLAVSLKVAPYDADLLLNRALLLQRTGRTDEARAAFRAVLAQNDDAVQLSGGRSLSAHAMARSALQAGGTAVAAR